MVTTLTKKLGHTATNSNLRWPFPALHPPSAEARERQTSAFCYQIVEPGSFLHVARALELDRLFPGAVRLRDDVDRVLQIPIVRGDAPEPKQDQCDRDGRSERPTRHRPGGVLNGRLNVRHEREDPDRKSHDEEDRPVDSTTGQ